MKKLIFLLLFFLWSCETPMKITSSDNDYKIIRTSEYIYIVKKGEVTKIIKVK